MLSLSAATCAAASDLGSSRLFFSAAERDVLDAAAGVPMSGQERLPKIMPAGRQPKSGNAAILSDSETAEVSKQSEPSNPSNPEKPAATQTRLPLWVYQGRVVSAAGTRFLINDVVWRAGLMGIEQIDAAPDARSVVVVMSNGQRQTLIVGKPVARAVQTQTVSLPDTAVSAPLPLSGVIAHVP